MTFFVKNLQYKVNMDPPVLQSLIWYYP